MGNHLLEINFSIMTPLSPNSFTLVHLCIPTGRCCACPLLNHCPCCLDCLIKQLNEPIEVRLTKWNTGGLLTRIEITLLSSAHRLHVGRCCYNGGWIRWQI